MIITFRYTIVFLLFQLLCLKKVNDIRLKKVKKVNDIYRQLDSLAYTFLAYTFLGYSY